MSLRRLDGECQFLDIGTLLRERVTRSFGAGRMHLVSSRTPTNLIGAGSTLPAVKNSCCTACPQYAAEQLE